MVEPGSARPRVVTHQSPTTIHAVAVIWVMSQIQDGLTASVIRATTNRCGSHVQLIFCAAFLSATLPTQRKPLSGSHGQCPRVRRSCGLAQCPVPEMVSARCPLVPIRFREMAVVVDRSIDGHGPLP